MEVLRIKLTCNVANYKKEETIEHKSTYPLPPYSTVIGAIHKTCGYTNYHEMDLSIQGKFRSMGKKVYTNHWFLDRVMTDRDILVKVSGKDAMSSSFVKVATMAERKDPFVNLAKSIDSYIVSDFVGAKIHSETLAREYVDIKRDEIMFDLEEKEIYKPQIEQLKEKIKEIKIEIKSEEPLKKSELNLKIEEIKKQITSIEETRKTEKETKILEPLSFFKTLNTSLKSYELLYDIQLCIHIKSDEKTLKDIEDNICNLTAIGRSEDFVEVIEIKRVKLTKEFDEVKSNNSFYIDFDEVHKGVELQGNRGISRNGTVYYLNKDYVIKNNKRLFNKVKVLYCSKFTAYGDSSENLFIDEDNMIVSLL